MSVPQKNLLVAGGLVLAGLVALKALSQPTAPAADRSGTAIAELELRQESAAVASDPDSDASPRYSTTGTRKTSAELDSLNASTTNQSVAEELFSAGSPSSDSLSSLTNSLPRVQPQLASTPEPTLLPDPVAKTEGSTGSGEFDDFLDGLLDSAEPAPGQRIQPTAPLGGERIGERVAELPADPAATRPDGDSASATGTLENSEQPNPNSFGPPANAMDSQTSAATAPMPQRIQLSDEVLQNIFAHLEYGRQLASKGSVFSARNEFIQGLTDLAKAHDYASRSTRFTTALSSALLALDESADLIQLLSSQPEQLSEIVAGHQSKIVDPTMAAQLVPMDVAQRYLHFAWNKLAESAAGNANAGPLLYSMGKLHLTVSQREGNEYDRYQAMCLFRACHAVDPRHAESANELAVQLARTGQLEIAKQLLLDSLRSRPIPMAWKNLATVHQMLGEHDHAARASNEFALMTQSQPGFQQGAHWVPPETFAAAPVGLQDLPLNTMPANSPQSASPPASPQNGGMGFGWQNNSDNSPQRTANQNSLVDRIKKIF